MPITRPFQNRDIPQMKALWKERFHDTDAFISFYFENRLLPDFSVITEEHGEIINMMYAYPVSYQIRDKILPSALLGGFATKESYEGQGYLRRSFLFLLSLLREKGFCCAPLTPVALPYYYAFGFFGASSSVFITADRIPILEPCDSAVFSINLGNQWTCLYACYQQAARRYSGMLFRSAADFQLKMAEYLADGALCFALGEQNIIFAYGIFYIQNQELLGIEILAQNPDAEAHLLHAVLSRYPNCRLRLKLPCDSQYAPSFAVRTVAPQGACGLLNVSSLLSSLGNGLPFLIKVTDPCMQENNGVFCFDGSRTDKDPQLAMDAGHLLQFILGYSSLAELSAQGFATIWDQTAASQLDVLYPKQACFIVDEY